MIYLRVFFFVILISLFFSSNSNAFKFDIWCSGTSLEEAAELAKSHNIKLESNEGQRKALESVIVKKYSDTLMGYPVSVNLEFTIESMKLFRIYITWNVESNGAEIHKAKLFTLFDDLMAVLVDKYTNREDGFRYKVFEDTSWCNSGNRSGYIHKFSINDEDKDTIHLLHATSCRWVSLDYQDNSLFKQQFHEAKDGANQSRMDLTKF